jgi:hypothetical protein
MLNFREIFRRLNEENARWPLAGGMNVFLQHGHDLTQDVDIFIEATSANFAAVNRALRRMNAAWGATSDNWKPVPEDPNWLARQSVICMTTQLGFLDIFTSLPGIDETYDQVWRRAFIGDISGVAFRGLCNADMLACQKALPENERKLDRIRLLERTLAARGQ